MADTNEPVVKQHLAVIKEPYLDAILDGRKQIELRLARVALPPYRAVAAGDLIWLKQSGGPIRAWAEAEQVKFFNQLTSRKIQHLRNKLQPLILAHDDFWRARLACRYGSLIWLTGVTALIEPIYPAIKVYSPWLVLKGPLRQSSKVPPGSGSN